MNGEVLLCNTEAWQHWATLGASNSGKNVHRLANYQVELFFAIIRIRRWASNLGQKKIEKGKQQQLVAVGASGKTLSLGSNPLSPSFVDTRPSAPSLCPHSVSVVSIVLRHRFMAPTSTPVTPCLNPRPPPSTSFPSSAFLVYLVPFSFLAICNFVAFV